MKIRKKPRSFLDEIETIEVEPCHGNRHTWRLDPEENVQGLFGFYRLVRYGVFGGRYTIKVGRAVKEGDIDWCLSCYAVLNLKEMEVWAGIRNLEE